MLNFLMKGFGGLWFMLAIKSGHYKEEMWASLS